MPPAPARRFTRNPADSETVPTFKTGRVVLSVAHGAVGGAGGSG